MTAVRDRRWSRDILAEEAERADREARHVRWCCDALERLVRLEGGALAIRESELASALWGEDRELFTVERGQGVWYVRAR